MKVINKALLGVCVSLLCVASSVFAADGPMAKGRPFLVLEPVVLVSGKELTLGQLGRVGAQSESYQKLVQDLKSIRLGEAPPPRMSVGIPGARILSEIEKLGISRDSISYSIPQNIEVTRAGREVEKTEVLQAVRERVALNSQLDVQVREVSWETSQVIPLGSSEIKVELLGEPSAGRLPVQIIAQVEGNAEARFLATALVDDWREVPVLNKNLERGMLISPSDLELVRLNMLKQPTDLVVKLDEIVGRSTKTRLPAGGVVRKSLIDIPPLVSKGKRLVLKYNSGSFQATAAVVALDDGLEGEVIRVRNENSKKVLKAKVMTEQLVEVVEL